MKRQLKEDRLLKTDDYLKELIRKYRHLPISFADSYLVLLAEKQDIRTIATIDRDFSLTKPWPSEYYFLLHDQSIVHTQS